MTHCYPKKQANAIPYSLCISNRARNVRILPFLYNISIAPRTTEYLLYTDSGFASHEHAQCDTNALWKMCCNYALPFTRANHSDAQVASWLPSVDMIKIWHKIMKIHRKKILPKKNGSSDSAYKGFKILGTLHHDGTFCGLYFCSGFWCLKHHVGDLWFILSVKALNKNIAFCHAAGNRIFFLPLESAAYILNRL